MTDCFRSRLFWSKFVFIDMNIAIVIFIVAKFSYDEVYYLKLIKDFSYDT